MASKQTLFSAGFVACILVMFTDLLGINFTGPVLVPYGRHLGASIDEIALFMTVRQACVFASMLWMPRMADKFGRMRLMLLSVVGSGTAYIVQGLASTLAPHFGGNKAGVIVFIVGRGIAGFFGGTGPVLQAAVTAMSMPDKDLTRSRLTVLTASQMSLGVALAPIAGALAFFGLYVPWVVAGLLTFIIALIVPFIYREDPIKTDKGDSEDKAAAPKPKQGSPFRDPYLVSLLFSFLAVFICISGHLIALPLLLMQDSFGLVVLDEEQTGKNVANATGIVGIPSGITNILFSTVVFLFLAKRIGEIKSLTIGGVVCSLSYLGYGFMEEVWQVALLQAANGAGLGLILPALAPIMGAYASAFFPDRKSEAMSVPAFGRTIGLMVGTNIFGLLLSDNSRDGIRATYLFSGGCFFVGIAIAFFALTGMSRATDRALGKVKGAFALTEAEVGVMIRTQAVEPEPFVDELCFKLRDMLTRGTAEYRNTPVWHGRAQAYMRRHVDRAFPKLRQYDEETNGRDYFKDVMSWLFPIMSDDERMEFLKHFSHVDIPDEYAHLYKRTQDGIFSQAPVGGSDYSARVD